MTLLRLTMLVVLAGGCARGPEPGDGPSPREMGAGADLQSAREALLAADAAASAATEARGYLDGFTAALASDAVYLADAADPVRGADAIRAWLAASRYAGAKASWRPIRGGVSADGSGGYTFGEGRITFAGDSTGWIRYLAYWKKQDGAWKIAAYLPLSTTGPSELPPPSLAERAGGGARPADAVAALEAVLQADRDFAALSVARNPGHAFTTYAAEDAALVARGGVIYGRSAISEAFGGPGTLEWTPLYGGVAGSGDLGWSVGESVFTLPATDGGQPRRIYNKYLSIWRREPGGEWRFVADGGNARPAPAR